MRPALPRSRQTGHRLPLARTPRALAVAATIALWSAPAAHADVAATIIDRCTHGQSLSGFSQHDYRRALQELPAEVEEYSDCANLIRRAQLAAAGGPGAGGSTGEGVAPLPLTPAERAALARVPHTGATPQRVGGDLVQPGVVHTSVASALSTLRVLLREDGSAQRGDLRRAAHAAGRLLSMRLPHSVTLEETYEDVPPIACSDGLAGRL